MSSLEDRVTRLEAALRDLVAELAVLASRHMDLVEMVRAETDLAAKVLATIQRNKLTSNQIQ